MDGVYMCIYVCDFLDFTHTIKNTRPFLLN